MIQDFNECHHHIQCLCMNSWLALLWLTWFDLLGVLLAPVDPLEAAFLFIAALWLYWLPYFRGKAPWLIGPPVVVACWPRFCMLATSFSWFIKFALFSILFDWFYSCDCPGFPTAWFWCALFGFIPINPDWRSLAPALAELGAFPGAWRDFCIMFCLLVPRPALWFRPATWTCCSAFLGEERPCFWVL